MTKCITFTSKQEEEKTSRKFMLTYNSFPFWAKSYLSLKKNKVELNLPLGIKALTLALCSMSNISMKIFPSYCNSIQQSPSYKQH
jgi:hypothetical protein